MPGKNPKNEMNKALFTSLVMMLSSSTMQQLGKLVNPITNKTEVNLAGAQVTIDMLVMLQEKTKGNLDKDEEKMLNDILASLQMNYVETSKGKEDRGQKTEDREQKPEVNEEKNDKESVTKQKRAENKGQKKKDPKFHKSYGE